VFEQAKLFNQGLHLFAMGTSQVLPIVSFSYRYLQETVAAYKKETGQKEIILGAPDIPTNLFGMPFEKRKIEFPSKARWDIQFGGGSPLSITFRNSNQRPTGNVILMVALPEKTFEIHYKPELSTPTDSGAEARGELSTYEAAIKDGLQKAVECQLL
jgi:hypothetical protein